MSHPLRRPLDILIIQGSAGTLKLLIKTLTTGGFDVTYTRVKKAAALVEALQQKEWDAIISDQDNTPFTSLQALALAQKIQPDTPFLILSTKQDEETAVTALKSGAHSFIARNKLSRLVPAIERELTKAQGRRKRKMLEKQLQQAQKMEAIGKLAGGIAHDFNNILSVIRGLADCMLRDQRSFKTDIQEIRQAASRGSSMTRQLLAFSRCQILQPVIMDLNASVENMKKMLQRLIGENIHLITNTPKNLWPIKADPGQIEQVVLNLALNARDAMPAGGRLTITTENTNWDGKKAGAYVRLTVKDNGNGIPTDDIPHIFEPFFTTKKKGKGTGLGLATVFGIVKQTGGSIDVESKPGDGSTFHLYFHRSTAPLSPKKEPALQPHPPIRSKTILLVEDEEKLRNVLKRYLQASGYTVLSAEDGEKALQLYKKEKSEIDLMITDIVMPRLNGVELAREMKRLRPEIPILYISGYSDHALFKSEGFKASENFLLKPFGMDALEEKIQQILKPRSTQRPLVPSV